MDEINPKAGLNNYNPQRDPVVVKNYGGNVHVMVADPEMAQDLLVHKNTMYDKTGTMQGAMSGFMGKSFLFSKTDEDWKAKRKACSHAFYKERLVGMIEV